MDYKKGNLYLGWLVFLLATTVYFITIEDTVSLWDCGEYITAAYKLEVGHPPGAPLFMLLGRLFTFFAGGEDAAVWINRMSALSSSFTILFMFWSITMLAKKMVYQRTRVMSMGDKIAVLGSGFIGSMAYTFSDSFWFSAVEGEVYAMSSLFTAIIFWVIMKWDEEMDSIQHGEIDGYHSPMRWLILIMFLFGLAIGVHLLGLLVIPTIAYVIYFREWKTFTWKGFLITGVGSIFLLGFIQEVIIPGTISLASSFEITFVNSMGMPFYVGAMFFFIILIGATILVVRWSRKNNKPIWNAVAMSFIFLLIGYGSFATIVIRSNANTPLDENDPENLVTLHAYLKREQYGSWPILNGPYWNSELDKNQDNWGDISPKYARRFVVTKGDLDVKAFRSEDAARTYAKEQGSRYDVIEKYYLTNDEIRKNQEPAYEQTTFFPRMFWNQDANKIEGYKKWSGYDATEDKGTELGKDGKRLPSFGENLTYFARYQVNWMYWRYFMWNFAGRQNDIQGHGDEMRGNWLSGVKAIDSMRLGSQDHLPTYTENNESYNRFFFLPLILGFIGMFFHFYRAPKDAFVVLLTFLFTGLAIVVYLNQKTFEPRERDYAYAASFYAFAMWIGLGVYALYDAFRSFSKKEFKGLGIIAIAGTLFCLIIDMQAGNFASTVSWLFICIVAALVLGIMMAIGSSSKNETSGAGISVLLTLAIPFIMAVQGWDDHDRSDKTSARDLAYNYLSSCKPNAIIFTNGDNDTFPLWYLQEVEGKFTDARVANLSLMGTDWYTDQMKMKAYKSEPLPIKFREDQILMYAGATDQVFFVDMSNMGELGLPNDMVKKLFEVKKEANKLAFEAAFAKFRTDVSTAIAAAKGKDASTETMIAKMKMDFTSPVSDATFEVVQGLQAQILELFNRYSNGLVEAEQSALQGIQTQLTEWEKSWDYMPIDQAMEFTRDDKNLIQNGRAGLSRIFPSRGFILPVETENAIASGVLDKKDVARAAKEIRFTIDKPYLTREQVMMMDVLANNDWKRPIYFSSPYGSDVSIALFRAGAVKQVGMAFEVSPIVDQSMFDKEKMFDNLMNKHEYGKMNQEGVLNDYYTRRHTSQFRSNFAKLADSYLQEADMEKRRKEQFAPQIKNLRAGGNVRVADSLENVLKGADERIADYKKRAIQLIKKSIEVMPLDRVIDYGEPNPDRQDLEVSAGISYPGYADGIMQDYVGILYRAGDKARASKLAEQVADQLESILNYFEHSSAMIAATNKPDLISAMNNYIRLNMVVNDEELGQPNSPLAKRMLKRIDYMYKTVFPKHYKEIQDIGSSSGESVREGSRGYYSKLLTDYKGHLEALAMNFGIIGRPVDQLNNLNNLKPEQIQQLMDMQNQE